MKKIILFILLISIQLSIAQRRYVPGVIYLRNNDTLVGKIKDQLFFSTRKIKFIDESGKIKKYSVNQITGYTKLGLLKYLVIPGGTFGTKLCFMQVVEYGNLILLAYTRATNSSMNSGGGSYAGGGFGGSYGGGIHTSGSGTTTSYYIKKRGTNKSGRVRYLDFKKFMLEYVSDDAEVKKLVEEKSLVFRDLYLIIQKYNENKRKQN